MKKLTDATVEATPEQIRYAAVLEKGMYVGLLCLCVTFTLYAAGVIEPRIALAELPQLWTMSVHEYLAEAQLERGWNWVKLLGHGDFLNFVGIVILAGVSVVCYLSTVPVLAKKGDTVYVVLVLLEVLVLVIAASGIIQVGH